MLCHRAEHGPRPTPLPARFRISLLVQPRGGLEDSNLDHPLLRDVAVMRDVAA